MLIQRKTLLVFFPSHKISKFTMFEKMMPEKKFSFMISNTDREDLPDTYWWNILNIFPTSGIFFFDLFGTTMLKNFIVTDNKKVINKVLKGIEKIDKTDQKLTLQKSKFSITGYKGLTNNNIMLLSETARDFLHLLEGFGKDENIA